MDAQSKPAWNALPEQIRNAWIQQAHTFYPLGSITLAEAAELARYEFEQSESGSLCPPAEIAAKVEPKDAPTAI